MENQEGYDVTNFRTDDEYGFDPYFGTYKKGPLKKGMLDDPDKKYVNCTEVYVTETYHDENGELRQKTTKVSS
jgi:hypothetical protein